MTIPKDDIIDKHAGTNSAATDSVDYPQICKPLLLLFCGYVFIWYLQIGYRIPALGSIRFEFIYAVLLTVLAIYFTPKLNVKLPLLPYVILYFLVIVIQIPLSYDFNTSWVVFLDRIIKFAFMSFFIVSFVRSPTHLKYFLVAFLLACMKMGEEGFVGRITGSLIWQNQEVMRLHGATPNYAHPNSFAGMALGTLPFIYFLWPLGNKYIKFLLFILGLLSLNILIYSGSRTGYIGMLSFIVYIFITSSKKKKFLTRFFLFVLLTLPLIPSEYIGRFHTIFADEKHADGSTIARKQILSDAIQVFVENPFGIGVAAFPKKRMDTFGREQDTHNLYLEIATNLGIQGLIIVGLLVFKMLETLHLIKSYASDMIAKLLDNSREVNNRLLDDLKLIEAVAFATSAFVIIRLALGFFGMDLYEIYWWFAMGITLSLYSMINNIKILPVK